MSPRLHYGVVDRTVSSQQYEDVYRQLSESRYGEALEGNPRWARYKPEHVEDEDWIRLLGADVDNLSHSYLTYRASSLFLGSCRVSGSHEDALFSPEEEHVLKFAACVHDVGEAELGDKNFELRTIADRNAEHKQYRQIIGELYPELDTKFAALVDAVIWNEDSKLARAFNAIERLGYIRTGLRAFKKSWLTDDATLSGHLKWMTAGTLSNQIIPLTQYARVYPPIHEYLQAHSDEISFAFSELSPIIFIQHGQTEQTRQDLYKQSEAAWFSYLSSDGSPSMTATEQHNRGIFGSDTNLEQRFVPDRRTLVDMIEAARKLGMKIVLTSGSFDLLHVGHMRYLEKAKKHGDLVVVGIDSDERIRTRKNDPSRPMVPELERIEMLAHLRHVDLITIKHEGEPKWSLIKSVKPDTLITTQESYTSDEVQALHEFCSNVVVLEPQATTSTTARIRKMKVNKND